MSKVVDKIDKLLSEVDAAAKYPMNLDKYKGHRPIQFMTFWQNYRPGDRINVNFLEDGQAIELFGCNGEGQFAGSKLEKDFFITDPMEVDAFKSGEGQIWNFV